MKITRATLLAILVILLIATPALAQTFRALYAIAETAGVTYTMFPASGLVNNIYLVANGYIEDDALDTRIENHGGTALPHMVASDRVMTATPVPANTNVNLYYTMGNDDLSSFDIIMGYNGLGTVYDTVALELGSDFVLEWEDIWIDTTAGADKNIIYKNGAFKVFVSAAVDGSITAEVDGGGSVTALGIISKEYHTMKVAVELR